MRDPREGVAADGTIVTGVGRERVPAAFEPVVAAAVAAVRAAHPDAALHLYGSVATGCARPGRSDVDLLTVGLPAPAAERLGAELSARAAGLCRAVEVAPAQPADLLGDSDEAYGTRLFLRHYCVPLVGPPPPWPAFPADTRAARGLNGDIAEHAQRWRRALDEGADDGVDAPRLARRVARKTLLAVAGLVSVHDRTWTTDRLGAARRWSVVDPGAAGGMAVLAEWTAGAPAATRASVARVLDDCVAPVVRAFAATAGLWVSRPGSGSRAG